MPRWRIATQPYQPRGRCPAAADGADSVEELRQQIMQLQQAVGSHAVIDQALGVVMLLGRCPQPIAWQVLVQTSQHADLKLRQVAEALGAFAAGGELPEPVRRLLHRALDEHAA